MYRKLIVVSTLLLLMLAVGVISAQSETPSKEVTTFYHPSVRVVGIYDSWTIHNQDEWTAERVCIYWEAPEAPADSYRISWKPEGGRWLQHDRQNTKKRGNARVSTTAACIGNKKVQRKPGKPVRLKQIDGSLQFPLHEHAMLIRIRARYDDERNGPWVCCIRISGRREASYGGYITTSAPGLPVRNDHWVRDPDYRDPEDV